MSHYFEVEALRDGKFTLHRLQKPFDELNLQLDELEDLLRTISAALGVAQRPPGPAPQPWPPPDDVDRVTGWAPAGECWLGLRTPSLPWSNATEYACFTHWIPTPPAPEDWPRPLKGDALTEAAAAITWACEQLGSRWESTDTDGTYRQLCKLRDTVRFAAAHGQQAVMDNRVRESDQLDAIREALLSYQCAEAVDDDGELLSLVDRLSVVNIDSGRREVERLAEHLWDTTDASVWGPAAPDEPETRDLAARVAELEEKVAALGKMSMNLRKANADLTARIAKCDVELGELDVERRQLDTRIDDVGNRLDHMSNSHDSVRIRVSALEEGVTPAAACSEPYLSGEFEIELMDHGRTYGKVTQQHPAGLVAVEVGDDTHYYGPGAIYRMTPLVVTEPRRCPGETFADRGVTPAEVLESTDEVLIFEHQPGGWWVYADGDHVFPTAKPSLAAAVSAMVAPEKAAWPEWSAEGWLSFVQRSEGWIAKRDGEPVFGGGVYFPTLTEAIRAAADDIPF